MQNSIIPRKNRRTYRENALKRKHEVLKQLRSDRNTGVITPNLDDSVNLKRKPNVIWTVQKQRRIPVKTMIINMDDEIKYLNRVINLDVSPRYKQRKRSSLESEFDNLIHTPLPHIKKSRSPSSKDRIIRKVEGDTFLQINFRTVKARLNSVYRAKIERLGIGFKFVLTQDEKMKVRQRHFKNRTEPLIPVQMTKAAELKEEFNAYCGRKTQSKAWLIKT